MRKFKNNKMPSINQLENAEYLNLETYRKNGCSMFTPVWFAQAGNLLFISTFKNSGKVKRIRSNPNVRVNPCGMQGELFGEWLPAQAHVATADETQIAEAALDQKYGERRRDFMRRNPMPPENRAYLVVEVPAQSE